MSVFNSNSNMGMKWLTVLMVMGSGTCVSECSFHMPEKLAASAETVDGVIAAPTINR